MHILILTSKLIYIFTPVLISQPDKAYQVPEEVVFLTYLHENYYVIQLASELPANQDFRVLSS